MKALVKLQFKKCANSMDQMKMTTAELKIFNKMFKGYGKVNNIENRILYLKNKDVQNGFPIIVELL